MEAFCYQGKENSKANPIGMVNRLVVFLYNTTHAVMHAAQVLERAGVAHEIIPRPKGADADCGIAISVAPEAREAALARLREASREPTRVLEYQWTPANHERRDKQYD